MPPARTAMLTPEQRTARERLIESHLALVHYVVARFARLRRVSVLVDDDDLLASGLEGLVRAADSFEPERGVAFSTWAALKIRSSILDMLRALDPLPARLRSAGKRIDRVAAALAQAQGRWPTEAELAHALGEPVAALRRTLCALRVTTISLDGGFPGARQGAAVPVEEDTPALSDSLADEAYDGDPSACLERLVIARLVRDAVAALPVRERLLIVAHDTQGTPLQAVARQLGVSEGRASQLRTRALRRLRESLTQTLDERPAQPAVQPLRHVA
jgi:RNA polymerase sigma factor FliA